MPLLRALALVLPLVVASAARAENLFDTNEAALIEVLKTGEPAAKAIACKKLAVLGTKDSVPLLAPLLEDEQLASWARLALEVIDDPSADAALRDAASKANGQLAIGAINSLGARRDQQAAKLIVDAFAAAMKADDIEAVDAAAWALGRIGGDNAVATLRGALKNESPAVRNAAAQGLVLAAEGLLKAGQQTAAAQIYDEARGAEVPVQRQLEATRGAILARGEAGIPLLVEQLRSDNKKFVQLGLGTARELPGAQVAAALVKELETASPERAPLLIYALADRKELVDAPAIFRAAVEGDDSIQLAAIKVLARADAPQRIDALLQAAADDNADVSLAAATALADMQGTRVNGHLVELLPTANGKQLAVLLNLVGKRRLEATNAVTKALANDDAAVRQAALAAFGETVTPAQLPLLVKECVAARDAADGKVAWRALKSAAVRMPDREACAEQLAAALAGADADDQAQLVDILGAVGGKQAIDAMAGVMQQGSDAVLDAGTRALGNWMEVDAAPVMLELATSIKGDKYQVRALRSYIRLARQFKMSDAARAEMCEKALDAATRNDERELVFAVLERYPNEHSLRVAKAATAQPELKERAVRVAEAIEQNSPGN
ncbi:HEAT repeat domain-containing protein [Lacipirellula sp.]|uniref:HEAT repeat domain-containing protein n=1 Tax=Lacipirellula sp. TaxID=2691419 RepID=UPI003D140763